MTAPSGRWGRQKPAAEDMQQGKAKSAGRAGLWRERAAGVAGATAGPLDSRMEPAG